MKKQTILKKLSAQKINLVSTVFPNWGSSVRNEQTPSSDIDILIDFHPEKETFQNYMAVCDMLENLFKRHKIDIVTVKGLSPYIGQQILNEVEYV